MAGLYVHVPYCQSKCGYCDFNSYPVEVLPSEELYVRAVVRELAASSVDRFETLYVGGGTPTALSPARLGELLEGISERIEEGAERTVEANPGSLTEDHLAVMREAGINRVSLGVQSTHPALLQFLGRCHTVQEAERAITMIRSRLTENISVDLIFGMPGLDEKRWEQSLTRVLNWDVPHVSLYDLTIEEGTPFHREGVVTEGDEFSRRLYETAVDHLTSAGYRHYEVSNFARSGYEARHNLAVWNGSDYQGLGAGAHSKLRRGDGPDYRRFWNVSDVNVYIERIENGEPPVESMEEITEAERAFEALMLTLRQPEGRSLPAVEADWGVEVRARYAPVFKSLSEKGLLVIENDHLRATRQGLLHLNTVLLEFLDE